jgi:hypothetical protein
MAGAYCKFCGRRCFLLRVIPDGPLKGRSFHLATCAGGMAHDMKMTGHTHKTAINPIADPDAAAATVAKEGTPTMPDPDRMQPLGTLPSLD